METNDSTQKTVQTVQEKGLLGEGVPAAEEKPRREEYYEIAKGEDGYHWALWSINGQIIARNAKPYASRQQAVAAIRNVQKKANAGKVVIS